jgi:hypothetical protein
MGEHHQNASFAALGWGNNEWGGICVECLIHLPLAVEKYT